MVIIFINLNDGSTGEIPEQESVLLTNASSLWKSFTGE